MYWKWDPNWICNANNNGPDRNNQQLFIWCQDVIPWRAVYLCLILPGQIIPIHVANFCLSWLFVYVSDSQLRWGWSYITFHKYTSLLVSLWLKNPLHLNPRLTILSKIVDYCVDHENVRQITFDAKLLYQSPELMAQRHAPKRVQLLTGYVPVLAKRSLADNG